MELWKDIKGFEGMYKVSNLGNVYSLKTNKNLSNKRLTLDGYNHVSLLKNGKAHEYKIHRLVALHFIDNPCKKETVNHIDGNKQNNSAMNLEWMTREENMQHAYNLGLKKMDRGSNHKNSKLTKEQVEEIKQNYKRYKKGYGSVAMGEKYGVHSSTILRIINGERGVARVTTSRKT